MNQLVDVDRLQSIDSQNPAVYRQRALLLQELGCNFLAMYDNRICAFLEERNDIAHYNHQYQIILTKEQFNNKYKDEAHTNYYKVLFDIVKNDELLLLEKIDPFHILKIILKNKLFPI